MGFVTPARSYFPGMGQAVADRTINRKKADGTVETWEDVAHRVAAGNASLIPGLNMNEPSDGRFEREFDRMHHHLNQASILMSGRHLQHGDEGQRHRNLEVFTNCSTAATSFLQFYLLLNGSGVGRCYDDAMMLVDWSQMPMVLPVIDSTHPDVQSGLIKGFLTPRDARHLYSHSLITEFDVPDSREGWGQAIEIMERMAYEKRRNEVLLLNFTPVRGRGQPIKGMQNRPSSGPGPLMNAIVNMNRVRDAGMMPWRQAMYIDHYSAECVLVGGARRAARMSTKFWRDKSIFDFIELKRGGFLWSSNNSVTVDQEFRDCVTKVAPLMTGVQPAYVEQRLNMLRTRGDITKLEAHAYRVLYKLAEAAYHDGTGEPAIINQDRLTQNDEGMEVYADGYFAESERLKMQPETIPLMKALVAVVRKLRYTMITNPCGEICLLILGGYCVIADVVPFHATSDADAEDAFRVATRALIRTNTMNSLYGREVQRTNRIGVGITGFHEWAYDRFKFTWHDIVDEAKSLPMWMMLSRFKRAVVDEAASYSKELNVVAPHTNTTFKPAGTTSKLFGLCEGAHLPSMRQFIRWVQFRNDDPDIAKHAANGYPVKQLKIYEGTTIVGFPTKPKILELDGGAWVVTAAEATPEEQYQFLRLLEKYWIRGVDENGESLAESGNQVSYTLKYDPKKVTFQRFLSTLIDGQFSVRCCSVMPQVDSSAYEYQPEQPVPKHEFEMIAAAIQQDNVTGEDIGLEHVDCSTGACPIDFGAKVAA